MSGDRVYCWRLLLEDYGPEIVYLPGHLNVVADAISRLEFNDVNHSKHVNVHKRERLLAVLLRSYSEETADYTFQTDAKSDTMVHTCTSDSTTIGTSRINNSHITTFNEEYEVVEPCRKQAFLQIQNLFAAKINSKNDEEIYPLTV